MRSSGAAVDRFGGTIVDTMLCNTKGMVSYVTQIILIHFAGLLPEDIGASDGARYVYPDFRSWGDR